MEFNSLIKTKFGDILKLHEFRLGDESKGIVEYSNDVLKITFSYDYRLSYEVDVTFLFKATGDFFSIKEIREYLTGEKLNNSAVQIVTPEVMDNWLDNVYSFLREYLASVIDNHIKICIELEGFQHQESLHLVASADKKRLIEKAEKFWQSKDFYRLVELLKNHEDTLSRSLKMKYVYAQKMIGLI